MEHVWTEVAPLRAWVKQKFQLNSTEGGNLWLPIVLTARGPLYAEVIVQQDDGSYYQPYPLADRVKQPLYRLGWEVICHLNASPAVYLLQFALTPEGVLLFDRIIPFPDTPAKASQGVQEPDLLTCHWLCLERQPIFDLIIRP